MDGSSFFKDQAPNAMAGAFRSTCSECGSPDLVWMTPRDLLEVVPADKKATVQEGIDFLGADGDAWLCRSGGHFGIMSQPGGDPL
jgi:hypothetical protein